MNNWRTLTIAVLAAVALAHGTRFARADERQPALASQPAAPSEGSEGIKPMQGCMPDGGCCGSCQAQQKQEDLAAKDTGGGCPCQKAKRQQQMKE